MALLLTFPLVELDKETGLVLLFVEESLFWGICKNTRILLNRT